MVTLSLFLLLTGQSQTAPTFDTDPRLAKAIPMAVYAEPLARVVADLSKEIGVPLFTEERLREELVVLVTKPRPARETMQALARHFGWKWSPASSGGYRIEPTETFARRANGGYALEVLPNMRKARAKAAAVVTELQKLTPAEIRKARESMAVPVAEGDSLDAVKEWVQRAKFTMQANPLALPAARTIAALSDDQLLSNVTRRIVFSSDPGPLAVAMTNRVRTEVVNALPIVAEMAAKAHERDPENGFAPFAPSQVREVRFEVRDPGAVAITLIGPTRHVLYEDNLVLPRDSQPAPALSLPKPVEDAISQISLPPTKPNGEPLLRYAQFLGMVAKVTGDDLIADAYDSYLSVVPSDGSQKVEAKRWASRFDVAQAGGWVTFRAKAWPMFRAFTVPRTVLAKLGERDVRLLTLDEKTLFATLLSKEQVRSSLIGWPTDAYRFYRFWAEVSPALRNALLSGESVPLQRLPASVHEYLYEYGAHGDAFEKVGSSLFEEPEFASPSPSGAEPGKVDRDYAGIFSKWLAPSASLSLRVARIPGIYLDKYKDIVGPSMLTELDSGELSEEDFKDFGSTRLGTALAMEFRFYARPGVTYLCREANVEVGRETKLDRLGWPEELVKRIAAAKVRAASDEGGREVRPGGIGLPPPP